jgi:lipopolysaccharide transport system ATP-binding protein
MPAPAVLLENVSKYYKLYASKRDRFREAFDPRRRKRHREFYALRGIDLEVRKGEILGIVGRNGAGKSTLLRVIAGVIQANSGRVEVNGRISALLELGAGLNPNLDGIQNIYFGGIMMGFSREEMRRRMDEIVSFADIGDFIRQPMRTYSSGMRARLGFALAVNVDPEILIVDEVLSVGDEMFRRKCYARMETIMAVGCTVLYVSHNINAVNQFCSRVVLVDDGEVLLQGPPKTVGMYYLRLMNASADRRDSVRREIRELQGDPARMGRLAPRAQDDGTRCLDDGEAIHRQEPFHIPELVPKSTLVQRNHEVAVVDARLLTPIGEPVNVLVMGDEYHLSFAVRFDEEARDVNFGVVIKSQKGVNLCSANLRGECIPLVAEGRTAVVHMYFHCNLLPGSYFVTFNSSALIAGQREVLIQVQDAMVFKVQAERRRSGIGGLAYCRQSLEAEIR